MFIPGTIPQESTYIMNDAPIANGEIPSARDESSSSMMFIALLRKLQSHVG